MFTCLAMQDSRDLTDSCSAPSHQMVCHAMETLTLLALRITIYTSVVWPAVGPKSKRASHVLQKVGPSKGIAADLGQPVPQWMIDSVKDRMVSSGHACLADIPKVASEPHRSTSDATYHVLRIVWRPVWHCKDLM